MIEKLRSKRKQQQQKQDIPLLKNSRHFFLGMTNVRPFKISDTLTAITLLVRYTTRVYRSDHRQITISYKK